MKKINNFSLLSKGDAAKPRGIFIWILIILVVVFIYKFIDKDDLIGVIFQNLPPREASLMAGMVFGDKNNFDKNTILNFRDSGVIHIMVVSGTNIVLVFRGLVERIASWFGRRRAIILGFGVTLIYINWVGWEIPAVRAFLLMSIFYWAQLLGRKFNLFRAMILIVLIMVLADYRVFLSGSFYLSFVAFGAVVINSNKSRRWWSDLWNSFWVSLWILPILALFFGKISLIAPISNALILFLVEVVTILGIMGSLVSLIVPIFGKIVLWVSYPILKYILLIVDGLAGFKWASVEIKFNWVWMVGFYLILITLLIKNLIKKSSLQNFL
ncbi:MAG: ComEC/Rec2 family competence protein [Candidatus Shapirobacteria bacterium]|nr:ComEC/Rec2 family competence protein [Candidatus Shapirobacteria bacterium]